MNTALKKKEKNQQVDQKKGSIIWLTGLSGSGKSTIADHLSKVLNKEQKHNYILDGDKVRVGLSSDLGFSPEDRQENIRRIGEVAKLFCDAEVISIVAFISPYCRDRDQVRDIMPEGRFIEVFVDCPLSECERRDPKGLYKKARAGEIPDFTGISAPYEPPAHPEIHLNTKDSDVAACVAQIMTYLKS